MKAKINEIFYSLQLEGSFIGYPAVFIRFSGCNLNCEFCDTKYALADGTIMNENKIYESIKNYKAGRIIFTGGEPALQDAFMEKFCKKFDGYDYFLETNGTIFIEKSINYFEHIVVSPKFFAIKRSVLSAYKEKAKSVEFKFIIDSGKDIEKAQEISDELNLYPITLQPMFDTLKPIEKYVEKTKELIEDFKQSELSKKEARLIIQNQKIVYKEKRGV